MLRKGLVFCLLSGLTMTVQADNPVCTNATSNLLLAVMEESLVQNPDYLACGGYLYPSYLHLMNSLPSFDYEDYAAATALVTAACIQLDYATQESCADNGVITTLHQQCLQLQASIPNC